MDINHENAQEMLDNATGTINANVATCVNLLQTIKWKHVSFIIPMAPKPSQRPRLSGYRVYVPGASKNGTFFNRHVLPTLKGLYITTPCKVKLDIYVDTPASFTKTQKILAEMRILRPWGATGDVDNYEKAVYDMIQPNEKRGHGGILSNDSLIIEACTNKYYSRTPRYEVFISYMSSIPKSIVNVMKLQGKEESCDLQSDEI